MERHELFANDETRITLNIFNPDSDKLLICFAEQGGGMGAEGFGSVPCKKYGWNQIFVGKSAHSRFRSLSIDTFWNVVSDHLTDRDVIAYGTSMGGYGALYYGGAIDARILAASPRRPGHPITDSTPAEDFPHTVHLKDVPLSAHQPVIIYDRQQNKDRMMVNRWALHAYPNANVLPVPRSGHESLMRLGKYKTLTPMLRAFVGGEELTRDRIRTPAGTIDRIIDDAIDAHDDGDYDLATELFEKAAPHLQGQNTIGVYAASIVRGRRMDRRERFLEMAQEGVFSTEGFKGSNRNFLRQLRDMKV